jgi:hypothetical protein
LGAKFENVLDFTTNEPDQERFTRIIAERDHTYAYRYAGLYVAQITTQWKNASFSIDKKPEIIATLWNLGFEKSKPHSTPMSGGATIDINGTTWSFGALAGAFYYSDELVELFPAK